MENIFEVIMHQKFRENLFWCCWALATSILLGGCTGSSLGYAFKPTGKGPFPAVLVLHTRGGLSQFEIDYASNLSSKGYFAIAVDYLTESSGDPIEKAFDDLLKNSLVDNGRIGMVGFSKGARLAISRTSLFHRFSDRKVKGIVSYYIGHAVPLAGEELPPILFLHGDLDDRTSPSQITQFCEFQKSRGRVCEMKIYKRVKHAFTHITPVGEVNEQAAEDALKKTIVFLNKYVKGK